MKPRNLVSSVHLAALLSFAFLIALFSYLIFRTYHFRFDLSEGKVYGLAPQTIQVLQALKSEPIDVYAFFQEDSAFKEPLENLLKEYAYRHPKFHYAFYDPDRMPGKVKQYQIDAYETIVIEAKGKREKTKQPTEEAITNALAKLFRQESKTINFASGYGNPSIHDEETKTAYGLFHKKLVEANYKVNEITIPRGGIPPRTDLLVFGGPRVDLLPEELKSIREYLSKDGNVMILIDPVDSGQGKNLEQFLLEYGVQLGSDVIVDKLSKLFGADFLIPLVTEYKPHVITQGFRLASFFPVARSVRKTKNAPPGFKISEIAWTGAGSWAETNLKNLSEGNVEFDAQTDQPGPVPMVVAVQKNGTKGGRMIVIGDSDFANNAYLNLSGNKDLVLNSVAWLTGDEFAVSIRPRSREATPLYLKETDQQFLFYVPVLGFPFVFLAAGTGVFFLGGEFH